MDLFEFLLVFTMLWKLSYGIRCYSCVPIHDEYSREDICEHFDYSEKFVKECDHSTMCHKKATTYTSKFYNVTIYTRGCASQVMNGDQVKENGKWKHVSRIHEDAYVEDCIPNPPDGRETKTVNCYCRGDLCNGGGVVGWSFLMLVLGSIVLYSIDSLK